MIGGLQQQRKCRWSYVYEGGAAAVRVGEVTTGETEGGADDDDDDEGIIGASAGRSSSASSCRGGPSGVDVEGAGVDSGGWEGASAACWEGTGVDDGGWEGAALMSCGGGPGAGACIEAEAGGAGIEVADSGTMAASAFDVDRADTAVFNSVASAGARTFFDASW